MDIKRRIFVLRNLACTALIAALVLIGYCPLRNALCAWLSLTKTTPVKTSGAHLLTANDVCKNAVAYNSNADGVPKMPLPLWPVIAVALFLFNTAVFSRLNYYCLSVRAGFLPIVPIFLRNRVWRI